MSKITWKLATDNKDFGKGLDDAKKQGTGWARSMEDVGKKLSRTFGAGDVFKGLLQGLGIGSVEKIAELIVSPWKRAAEYAKELASYSEKATSATLKLIGLRRTDEQNLVVLKKDQARLQKQANEFARSPELSGAQRVEAERVKSELAEKALEVAELELKLREKAAAKQRELNAAREAYNEKDRRNMRETLPDEVRQKDLLEEMNKLRADAGRLSDKNAHKFTMLSKALDLENEAHRLGVEIQEEKARKIEDARKEQEKAAKEAERHAEKMADLNEKIADAQKKVAKSQTEVINAQFDPFRFTLGDAASGSRGSGRARGNSRLIQSKEDQARSILDRNNLEFGEDGKLRYVPAPGESPESIRSKQRITDAQTLPRLRSLMGSAEKLRRTTPNLDRAEQDPAKVAKEAYKEALDESKTLQAMKKSLEGKFKNQ